MRTGHTPSRTKQEYWENLCIPWFTLADVWQLRNDQMYLGETKELISPLGLANSAAELLPAGTVVLSRTASVGFTGIMPAPMATSQDFWNWVCGPEMLPVFLWYQMRAMRPEFDRLKSGSTHKTIYQSDAAGLRVVVPPIHAQRQIADYLDHETAEIDAFISDLVASAALVRERLLADLEHLVWPFGVDTVPLRRLLSGVDQGVSPVADGLPAGPGEVGVLKAGCTNDGWFTVDANKRLLSEDDVPAAAYVHPGELIVTRASGSTRHVASAAIVPTLDRRLAMSDKHYRLRPNGRANALFLEVAMQTKRFRSDLEPRISGAAGLAKNISIGQLLSVGVPNHSLAEQQKIAATAERDKAALSVTIADIDLAIALAKERRAALITAAVTGQIDVTTRQKPVVDSIQESR